MKLLLTILLSLLLSLLIMPASGQVALTEQQLLDSINQAVPGQEKAFWLKELAWLYKSERPGKAHGLAEQSRLQAELINDKRLIADALHTDGVVFWYEGKIVEASEQYFKALRLREQTNDSLGLSRSYNNIGHVYSWQKEYRKAQEYYQKSLAFREAIGDRSGMVYSLVSLAEVMLAQQMNDRAIAYCEEALSIACDIESQTAQAFCYEKMGALYLELGDREKALLKLKKALELNRALGDLNQRVDGLLDIAQILHPKEKGAALDTLRLALNLSEHIGAQGLKAESLHRISAVFASMQQHDSAYYYLQEYGKLDSALASIEREQLLLDVQERYQSEKRKAELLATEKSRDRNFILFLAFAFIAVLLFSLLLFSRFRTQRRTNLLLQEKAKEIARQNREIADQNDNLLQSNHALEQMAFVSSHDLREPVRTIGAFTTLLARRNTQNLDQDSQEYMGYIMQNTKRLSKLLDELSLYTSLSQVRSLHMEPLNLDQLVAEVLAQLEPSIKAKGAVVEVAALPNLYANRKQIRQLFMHLIANGLKFNEHPAPRVSVASLGDTEGGKHFVVQDNGIGIEPAYHEKVFSIFKRLDRDRYEGTGVGLAICEKIVSHHRGKIWIASDPGQQTGAAFHFTIKEQQQS